MSEDTKKKMRSIIERNGGSEELISKLRQLLFPKEGMSDPIKRGLSTLANLEDRDLFELFTQHVANIPRERLVAALVNRLKKKASADEIMIAYPAFERWLVLADQLRPDDKMMDAEEFDWEQSCEKMDGLEDLKRLTKFHEFELRKLLEETKKFPSLARSKEVNRHVEVLRKLYAELLRIEVATGLRTAAPQNHNVSVQASGAFQELMTATSQEKTSTMQVIDSLLKVVHDAKAEKP